MVAQAERRSRTDSRIRCQGEKVREPDARREAATQTCDGRLRDFAYKPSGFSFREAGTVSANGLRMPETGFGPPRSLLINDAAALLGVSRRTIYYRIREGRLRTIRTKGGSQ